MFHRFCCAALVALLAGTAGCSDDTTPPDDQGIADGPVADGPVADGGPGQDGVIDAVPGDTWRPPAKWTTGPDMLNKRSRHTATLLADGRVLVVGGIHNYKGLTSAEIYDPKQNKWIAAGNMSTAHWAHTAHRLDGGRVIVIGGCSTGPSNVCMNGVGVDLYDPNNKTKPWSKGTAMSADRRSHCSVKLKDGKILVAGGFSSSKDHTSIEIYNPGTGFWSLPTATMSTSRNQMACVTLKNGRVALIGGWDATSSPGQLKPLGTIAIYNPSNGTLKLAGGKLKEPRAQHTATLLPGGQVLITGGECDADPSKPPHCKVNSAEIYDPVTDKVVPAGSPGKRTVYHQANLLATTGDVIVTGGLITEKVAMLYQPKASMWTQTKMMAYPHEYHAAVLLNDGRLLVTGGEPGGYYDGSTKVELYTP